MAGAGAGAGAVAGAVAVAVAGARRGTGAGTETGAIKSKSRTRIMYRGGDGSVVDNSRRSPLHYAVEKGLTRIVQVEVEAVVREEK